MLRVQSLRFRLAAAYIVGTLIVAGVVAGTTYVLVSRTLARQRTQTLIAQSFKGFQRVHNFLGQVKGYSTNEIVTNLQTRGNDVVVIVGRQAFPSSARVSEEDIPPDLQRAVRSGRVGYEITATSPRRFVFGSRVPDVPNHEAFLFYTLGQLDRTLGLLRKIFLVVVAGAAAVAGAAGFELAGRTIRPLRLAAEAARQVAEGNLDTRLETGGEDELGQLARAFNQMTEALTDRIHRERRFVADASHELRTPLTALKTSIDYLANRANDLPAKLRGPMALAADEVRSFQRLVDDLLELTRVEAGSIEMSMEDVDLRDFATQVVRRRAPETDVEIEGPETLLVRTDKMRLERVVGNLVENAVFHGAGHQVRIILGSNNGEASIAVEDQGPGIDSEQISRIFERFWRGDTARRRDGRVGSGLGLAIARENATLIGADMTVSSEPGVGTRFEVVLPKSEAEA